MPLEKGSGRAAFSRNVATEVNAGKPQKQAVAIAYAQRARSGGADARSAGVRVLGGEDPVERSLVNIPAAPARYTPAAGLPWGVPANPSAEPAPRPIVSKTPHEPATAYPVDVIPSEPLQRVANAAGTDRATVRVLGDEDDDRVATMGSATGDDDTDIGGTSRFVQGSAGGNAAPAGSWPDESGNQEGHASGNYNTMGGAADERVGFKAVEEHAAKEGARDPAAVAAAVGMKKYGKAGMERKAEAGKDSAAVEEAERVNRSPPTY